MWIAELDFGPAPVVVDAVSRAVRDGRTGYSGPEQPALAAAYAEFARATHGQVLDPDRMVAVSDVMAGVNLALRTFTPPGAPVAVLTPSYPLMLTNPAALAHPVIEVEMPRVGGRHVVDLDALDDAFDAGAHTLCLIQPHNPVGRVFDTDELRGIAEIVDRHGGRVINDEMFAPVAWNGHRSYAAVSDAAAAHTASFVSAGKTWGFPGLGGALWISHSDADAAAARSLPPPAYGHISPLGVAASIAAFTDGEPWRAAVSDFLRDQAQRLESELARRLPEMGFVAPEATFLAWLDLRPWGLGANAADRLGRHGLVVNNGPVHGAAGEGFVRFNFGTTRAIVGAALDRLEAALSAAD